jgi:hypothetical protein
MVLLSPLSQSSWLSWKDLLPLIPFCLSASFLDLLDWIADSISQYVCRTIVRGSRWLFLLD